MPMKILKYLVFLALSISAIPVFGHEAAPGPCDGQLKLKPDSERRQAYIAQLANYFSHLPEEHIATAVELSEFNPGENLNVLLEITRGEKDKDGHWIKKPLQSAEIENLFGRILPGVGPFAIARLYNSPLVDRDPVLFYESVIELYGKMARGLLTRDEMDLVGKFTVN